MSRRFSVGELMTRMRIIGDWQNLDGDYSEAGSYMSSGTLMRFLDSGNAYAWNVYAEADEGWNLTRYSFSTVASSASYALPSDHFILKAVETTVDGVGTGWLPLVRATVDDDRTVGSQTPVGGPSAYRLVGDSIELLPTPGDVRTVRLTYTPAAQVISSSLQTIDGIDGYEQVAVLKACILGRIREERPFADLQEQLSEHLEQMRRNVRRRDRGTPAHTRDRRDSWQRFPRRWGR